MALLLLRVSESTSKHGQVAEKIVLPHETE